MDRLGVVNHSVCRESQILPHKEGLSPGESSSLLPPGIAYTDTQTQGGLSLSESSSPTPVLHAQDAHTDRDYPQVCNHPSSPPRYCIH